MLSHEHLLDFFSLRTEEFSVGPLMIHCVSLPIPDFKGISLRLIEVKNLCLVNKHSSLMDLLLIQCPKAFKKDAMIKPKMS